MLTSRERAIRVGIALMFCLAIVFRFVRELARERLDIAPVAPDPLQDFHVRFRLLAHTDYTFLSIDF